MGFVSQMIMGMAARFVPDLCGADRASLPSLRGPSLLISVGCLLRVALQGLTTGPVTPTITITITGSDARLK